MAVIVQGTGQSPGRRPLAAQPLFEGPVERERRYIIVDDYITLGTTSAALCSHIQSNGGRVIAASTLTAARNSTILAPTPRSVARLRQAYRTDLEALDGWWTDYFGYGLDCLTAAETGAVAKAGSLDAI